MSVPELTRISRIEFVKGTLAAVSSFAIGSSNHYDPTLTFARIGEDIYKVQKFIDDIVAEEPLPYVASVWYAETGEIVGSQVFKDSHHFLNDPEFRSYMEFIANHPDTQESPKRHQHFADCIKSDTCLSLKVAMASEQLFRENGAITYQSFADFGRNKHSVIFVSREEFGDMPISYTRRGPLNLPLRQRIKVSLRHEQEHARQNYYGKIKVNSGFVIDRANRLSLHPRVVGLASEADAYITVLKEYQRFGEFDPRYLLSAMLLFAYAIEGAREVYFMRKTPQEEEVVKSVKYTLDSEQKKVIELFDRVGLKFK